MGIDSLVENGATLTQFLQTNFPSLKFIMQGIHILTEPEICFLLFIGIYWGINRDKGATYLYLFGLVLVTCSILSHLLRFPAPFWFENQLFEVEARSFAAPNLNTAVALLLIYPFKRFLRTDLTLPVFLFASVIAAISQVYLGFTTAANTVLGFLVGTTLILVWQAWNKRYGKRFAQRILGQRFWAAILFPTCLAFIYITFSNWSEPNLPSNIDPQVYWRSWQTGYINSLTALAILGGIGIGIAVESARVGFRPNKTGGSMLLNWIVGFGALAGLLYLFRTFFPTDTLFEAGGPLSYISMVLKYTMITITITYIMPWLFTMVGTATAEAATVPTISLNNFSVSQQRNSA